MANHIENRCLRVLDYIHDHPADDLSLDLLADVAAMSRFHWHRVFRAITGETAAQAVRTIRMRRAACALVQTDAAIDRIGRDVGYPNPASFRRAFKDSFRVTPAAFRARGELRPFLAPIPEVSLMYPVAIRLEPARRLAALPHRGPYPEINRAFAKLGAVIGARGLYAQTGAMLAVFYDDPAAIAAADLSSHAGLEVGPDLVLDAPLEQVMLPAGRHAVLTYTGPYAGLPAAYDQLFGQWLPQSGEDPADHPSFEIYRNAPQDTAPEDLITEICLPLK